jgi:hypothetical protein
MPRSRLLLCLTLAACGGDAARTADTASTRDSAAVAAGGAPDTVSSPWAVSDSGAGPVRVGMSAADVRRAVGGELSLPVNLDATCEYTRARSAPGGLRFMLNEGQVARVDADSAAVPTTRGVRVGDGEARVRERYGSLVREEPHKYVAGGRYLVVRGADTTRALVFETDGRVVTRLRGGRLPEVLWVEGCG